MGKVLIIDDEKQILSLLSRIIGLEGYEVFQATNCKVGIKQLEQNDPEVVLCDVCLPDGSGVELVSELKRLRPLSEVILLTAHGNIPDGVQAIKNGAFDYITKGDDNNKILPLIAKAMEKATVAYSQQKAVGKQYSFATVIGRSPAIEEAVSLARKVAATDVPVLLTGETGTGKEVFAQSIHQHSSRSDKAFVAINCSSFSRDLLESEMFGHKAGAFTGALKETKGLFEEADNGTIFLDEIGELDKNLQVKLLRVLQQKEFDRVGGEETIHVDVRIIAATNRDLEAMVREGTFRDDLYYRLNVIPIILPPLRDRPDDIPLLVEHFIEKISKENKKDVRGITPDAMQMFMHYRWPGNVRELENVIERVITLMDTDLITAAVLPSYIKGDIAGREVQSLADDTVLPWEEYEKQIIANALRQGTSFNGAAKLLRISHKTVAAKARKYGLV